jgi:hypothetical protein
MESFAEADLHKRVTPLAVLRDGQPPSQFRFESSYKLCTCRTDPIARRGG